MKVLGIKVDWNKYMILPQEVVGSNLLSILTESRFIDDYNNKVVDGDNGSAAAVKVFDTTTIEGWDKPVEVIEIEGILSENNRLQRELDKALAKLAERETISTSTELAV